MPHLVLAYIDPGSGSLIIQLAIASIIAIPVMFRSKVAALTRSLRRGKRQDGAGDGPVEH